MNTKKRSTKPLLRGYFHQEAFYTALGACILLMAKSSNNMSLIASIIYSIGLLMMLGVSAIYHRPHWEPKPRAFLKRLDHAAIFVLIASTATPLFLLTISAKSGNQFIIVMWAVALLGILQSIFWIKAPKFLSAAFYVGMGWITFPYLSELKVSLGSTNLWLIISGGITYTAGAVFYALKKPNLWPRIFGYHEVFHIFTIIGAILHFIVIYQLIK
ncbi:MAG: hemolysin III [Bdellovibrionaceae bacterium]|jgi:hemolysin III|nr:hemolysin III [Pseudobdellovibrionaceae bacterium]